MARLSKFLRLAAADRRLLLETVMLVWAVRLGLWLLPFRVMRRLLAKLASNPTGSQVDVPTIVARGVWAVTVACRYVPAATCLTQALVTKVMLTRNGHGATVRIGVARTNEGQFKAHAWVETDGKVVIGGPEASLKQYAGLTAIDGESW
jgi:Transglutaminase-like superfamily